MSFTREQLIERRQWLGASEVAAALGLSPYMTPNELFWLKRPDLIAEHVEPEQLDTEAIRNGNMTEEINILYAERKGGWKTGELIKQGQYIKEFIRATPDGFDPAKGIVVEAKYTGKLDEELWGESDTDVVPQSYFVQCLTQMFCTGASECHLYVIFPSFHGFNHQRYIIRMDEANQELFSKIYERAESFWKNHVEAGIPPDPSAPAPDFIVNNVVRDEAKEITLEDKRINATAKKYLLVQDKIKSLEATKQTLRGKILTAMGDATRAFIGNQIFTAKQSTRRSLDVDGIRAKHPEIAREFTKITPSTTLTHKEAKP